jgi:hypothetical protein
VSRAEESMPKSKIHRTPKIGSAYERKFKGATYRMVVVDVKGRLGYRIGNVTFPSPSAADKSVTKVEVNGWRFWKID